MNNETLEALEKSIAKWKSYSEDKPMYEIKLSGYNCPLCQIFAFKENTMENCLGCPVMKNTETAYCEDTPFIDADICYNIYEHKPNETNEKNFRKAAKKEYKFLKYLLPVKE